MIDYLKNFAFIFFIFLSNLPIGIKAVDAIFKENDHLLSNPYFLAHEREQGNKTHLKQREIIENQETRKFRNKVDKIALEFENFDSLHPQEQSQLVDKWKTCVHDLVIQRNMARHNMMDKPLEVSDETWQKLRSIQRLCPKEKQQCIVF